MAAPQSIKLPQLFGTFVLLFSELQAVKGADAEPAAAPLKTIPAGVYDLNHTLVIPRQRKLLAKATEPKPVCLHPI